MNILRLDHIGIRVRDFERTIAFYRQLGFEPVRRDEHERVVVLKHAGGIELNLLDNANADAGGNALMDRAEKYPGYTHYAIAVESVADAQQFLQGLGLRISEGPVTFGDGKTSVFVRDPDLNVIEFTQPAGQAS